MPRVLIECPETHKLIYTGLNMNWSTFESTKIGEQTYPRCPECGEQHVWTRRDAVLDEIGSCD